MRKLALYLKWVIIIFSLRLFYLIGRQIWFVTSSFDQETMERDVFFGIKIPENLSQASYVVISILSCLLLIYVLYLLNIFRLIAQELKENQIFNHKNSEQLMRIGKGLFVFGIVLVLLQIVISMSSCFNLPTDGNFAGISGYIIGYFIAFTFRYLLAIGFPIFMAALFVFIIAKLTKEGNVLKQENELTI
jgi:hypothetical protein